MHKIVIFIACCVALASCQERRQQRAMERDAKFCQSIGAGQGAAYTQCMLQMNAQNQANMRNAAAVDAQVYNNAIIQSTPRRTVTCHTTSYGHTHCF